jgi:hypothetical protein
VGADPLLIQQPPQDVSTTRLREEITLDQPNHGTAASDGSDHLGHLVGLGLHHFPERLNAHRGKFLDHHRGVHDQKIGLDHLTAACVGDEPGISGAKTDERDSTHGRPRRLRYLGVDHAQTPAGLARTA